MAVYWIFCFFNQPRVAVFYLSFLGIRKELQKNLSFFAAPIKLIYLKDQSSFFFLATTYAAAIAPEITANAATPATEPV